MTLGLTFEIKDSIASYTDSKVLVDVKDIKFEAYNINDNNYFKLRDLGKLFDFNVSWDATNNCILIDSTSSYIE